MSGMRWVMFALGLCACSPGGRDALRARPVPEGTLDAACLASVDAGLALGSEAPASDPALRGVSHRFFQITVRDGDAGIPIVGARLETVDHTVYVSDDMGNVAFYEPGLMNRDVWFTPTRDGYDLAPDGLGNRGKVLHTTEGAQAQLTLTRSGDAGMASVGTLQTRLLAGNVPGPADCFAIRLIDQSTRRGVPLVTLATSDEQYVSDSQGMVAYCNPDHLASSLEFAVSSHGYHLDAGSVTLALSRGGSAQIELTRDDVAERLYRSTGVGIYRDSVLLGLQTPLAQPLLDGDVAAQDSVAATPYRGSLFWLWGDTNSPEYPLPTFFGTSASSRSPTAGGLDPALGVDLTYVTDANGKVRPLADGITPTSLPTWLSELVNVPDASGQEQLFAVYAKPNSDLSLQRFGLAQYDTTQQTFVASTLSFPSSDAVTPGGQPQLVAHGSQSYVYYGAPLRVPASSAALLDASKYEVFSAFDASGTLTGARDANGVVQYAWVVGAKPATAQRISTAKLTPDQVLDGHLADVTSGTAITPANHGAQSFSERRKRFVRVVAQLGGSTSNMGEVWYVEADTPMGPWVYAQKILTHQGFTFYNPWLHPYFTQDGGRQVYFEGTFSDALAGTKLQLPPRYTRNQIAYRLDLDDTRLSLPVAVYAVTRGGHSELALKPQLLPSDGSLPVAFYAPDKPSAGTLPVWWSGPRCGPRQLMLGGVPATAPLFYAVDPANPARAANLVPLFDFVDAQGQHRQALDGTLPGFTRAATPLAYVWPSPTRFAMPASDYLGALVANAGDDQCLREARAGEGADVRLDASASQGAIAAYRWFRTGDPCPFAQGASAQVHWPVGTYGVELEVVDASGTPQRAAIVVQIAAND